MQRIEVRGCLPTALVLVLLAGLVGLAVITGTAVLAGVLLLGAIAAAAEAIRRRLRPRRKGPVVTVDAEGPVVEIEPVRRDGGREGPGGTGA